MWPPCCLEHHEQPTKTATPSQKSAQLPSLLSATPMSAVHADACYKGALALQNSDHAGLQSMLDSRRQPGLLPQAMRRVHSP